jgi:hypothetical protein
MVFEAANPTPLIVPLSCTPLRFPGKARGVVHNYTPTQPALLFSSSLFLRRSLSCRSEMSGPPQVEPKQIQRRLNKGLRKAYDVVTLHLSKHTGVGFICAIAYFDPLVVFAGV